MKTNKFKMVGLLMCIAAAFSIVSCEREDGPNNNGGGNDNTPLSNETIVGKKLYTDKLPSQDNWVQSEIRFAANNVAYLTNIKTDYVSGEENPSNPERATFNLVYPDVVFETEDGKSYSATFTDNNKLVFNGGNINEELVAMEKSTPTRWSAIKGWHFKTHPQTITGPYVGQRYECDTLNEHSYFVLGVNCAIFNRYAVNMSISYPNISFYDDQGTLDGYFINDTSILMHIASGYDFVFRRTRVFN